MGPSASELEALQAVRGGVTSASPRSLGRREWIQVAVVSVGIAGLALSHFTASSHDETLHSFLFKATFLPLVLAGLWFGLRGAALAATLTVALYLVHIFVQLAPHGHHDVKAMVADVVLVASMGVVVGILSDRREQARQAAVERAEQLRNTTEVLFRAEEDLRRADRLRSLGELAAGMAHELRNPLGGIRGAADILARESTDAEAREEFREVLRSEVARLDRVVENFLTFARPSDGERGPVVLPELASSVLLLLTTACEARAVVAEVRGAAGVTVRSDADLLRQVLLNLCLNSLQAMGEGGELTVEVATHGEGAGARASVEVRDTGTGIPESVRERIFDPFVTGRPEGTGLGLATAYRILESLGGTIHLVETGPGGTTIRFELPC